MGFLRSASLLTILSNYIILLILLYSTILECVLYLRIPMLPMMPVSDGKTQVQIGSELKQELMYLKAKYKAKSYEEVIIILMKENGLWKQHK